MRRTTIVQTGPFLLSGLLMLVSACTSNPFLATAPTGQPGTTTSLATPGDHPEDAKLLADLARLPPGRQTTVDGRVVEAGAFYSAASGNACRPVQMLGHNGEVAATRLVCRKEGQPFFAAEVFSTRSGAVSHP